jgi:Ala-tRNA(Pro) deacylase
VLKHAPVATANEVAVALHVSGKVVAKAVIVKRGDQPVMVVLPAHHQVDVQRLSELMEGKLRLARESELRELFPDCELGAVPPFGNLYHLPVWVAEELTKDDEIVFVAGSHAIAIRMKYADYADLVSPHVAACSHLASAPPRKEPASVSP